MIVWQGLGFLAALIPVILIVIMDKAAPSMVHGTAVALVISAIIVWLVGTKLNGGEGKVLVDPETEQEVVLKKDHTLFWIPMQWIGVAIGALGVYTYIKTLF